MAQGLLGTQESLCSSFQQFAMLSAADTPTGKGTREAVRLFEEAEGADP